MKILKPGRPQTGYSIKCTCTGAGNGNGGCGAKLLVEAADLYLTHSHCRDETDGYVTFKCSACGVLTDIAKPTAAAWEAARKNGLHPAVHGRPDLLAATQEPTP